MLRGELIEDLERLEQLTEEWDTLAVAASRPYCAPAWLLAWWRHVAVSDAKLRAIAVFDGVTLVGIAPFYVSLGPGRLTCYRLLGSETCTSVEPLARPGLERDVGTVLGAVLASARPAPAMLRFEGIPEASPWPELLNEAWARSRA